MEVQQDFKELLELLNENKVDYMIVGGYALAFHGAPRYTGDLDIYVKSDNENAERVTKALSELGFRSKEVNAGDFIHPERVVQLGVPPVRIDIVTSLTGVTWEEAFNGRVKGKYGTVGVYYIGHDQFIKNKKATGRKQDLADLESLAVEI